MFKTVPVFLALVATAFTAEMSSSYAMLEKQAVFKPEFKMEPVETHVMKEVGPEAEHPVYTADVRNQGRARIEPVRSFEPVIKHDAMSADQPAVSTEVNRNDEVGIHANGYVPGTDDVAYPDILHAPGYFYNTAYSASNNYDMYGANNDLMEPDTSTFGLLWSQVPYAARTMVGFVGRTIGWVLNSMFVFIIGFLSTVGVCTFTNFCTIVFQGVEPIHKETRAFMSRGKLEKISRAADFVKTAINKYQTLQSVTDATGMKRRRAIFN